MRKSFSINQTTYLSTKTLVNLYLPPPSVYKFQPAFINQLVNNIFHFIVLLKPPLLKKGHFHIDKSNISEISHFTKRFDKEKIVNKTFTNMDNQHRLVCHASSTFWKKHFNLNRLSVVPSFWICFQFVYNISDYVLDTFFQ